eukprot:CAMPEP_0204181726 /NCGR_PEP_ID=MMETSP0361-20130328/52171_1 /ASSEMBLY_ACC=CAM_ASM_000343 /TAXON_ID=268821 /ORGANISM="Scrippsiella Hangoei, Strain SHTV-5" /LENGTH=86 /DNA_ID=CAMNT_0051141343 /DNA_START=39 /DNA_END=295 /DNA_ORIENTATION=+
MPSSSEQLQTQNVSLVQWQSGACQDEKVHEDSAEENVVGKNGKLEQWLGREERHRNPSLDGKAQKAWQHKVRKTDCGPTTSLAILT